MSNNQSEWQTIVEAADTPLDPTGVPNLDLLLGGGLQRGSLTIQVGPPGCGKTTLAAQMAFAAAKARRRVLILTTLSEPVSKLLLHLRGYTFFDEALIGDTVRLLSLQQFMADRLAVLAAEVMTLARAEQASLVILDGFSGVRAMDTEARAARGFLFNLGTSLSLLGATTLITTEAEIRDPFFFPEGTTADCILGLYFSVQGETQRRRIEVVKVRGGAPLPGLHGLAIGATGIIISPRLEAQVVAAARERADTAGASAAMPTVPPERATFGLPALDALVGGGLTRATTTMVIGSGGTGKTLLGLHFALSGVRAGEPVVFMGFHEEQHQLQQKADAFNLGPALRAALAPGGGLTLLHTPAVEIAADALVDTVLAALDQTRAQRLVVDSIAVIERAVAEGSTVHRVQGFLAALVSALQARRITALFTKETGPFAGTALELETDLSSGVAENVLWLQGIIYREQFYRVLSVLKMRYSAHDLTLREFTISAPEGIEVRPTAKSAHGVLVGIARQQGDPLRDHPPATTEGRTTRGRPTRDPARHRAQPPRAER
jgi:circadian clock protein KaiC